MIQFWIKHKVPQTLKMHKILMRIIKSQKFDMKKENRYPTTKEICCWRLLRARLNTNEFFTSEETIRNFETSKTLAIIGWLLTVNLFLMYTIALLPFVIKSKGKVPVASSSDALVEDIDGSTEAGSRML